MEPNEELVRVRRQWNAPRSATYRLGDVRRVRWDDVSGGVRARSPQEFLHGYVDCEARVDGELDHSGLHGPHPHEIKVCIVERGNEPAVFNRLKELAGPQNKPPTKVDRALDAIIAAGAEGILQTELQKVVRPSSMYASKLWRALEKRGAIRTKESRLDRAGRRRGQFVWRMRDGDGGPSRSA